MAAASAAIAAQQTPEIAKEVAAFAAAANLLTTTIGTYFTLFISLPFTVWAYGVLEPVLGRIGMTPRATATADIETQSPQPGYPDLTTSERVTAWVVTGAFGLLANWIGYGNDMLAALPGMAIMLASIVVGYLIYRLIGPKIPVVCWVSLVAMLMTCPGVPLATEVAALTGKVNFLALTTPILAFAGLSLAKDVPMFRRLGWPIIVTSLMANAGTFMGATIIAQFFRH